MGDLIDLKEYRRQKDLQTIEDFFYSHPPDWLTESIERATEAMAEKIDREIMESIEKDLE